MRFPGNCLIVSVLASMKPGNRLAWKRNKYGRIHFFWMDRRGSSWEFYKRGASQRSYLQNSFYIGEVKRIA